MARAEPVTQEPRRARNGGVATKARIVFVCRRGGKFHAPTGQQEEIWGGSSWLSASTSYEAKTPVRRRHVVALAAAAEAEGTETDISDGEERAEGVR